MFKALFDLKDFNYKYIYAKANTKEEVEYYREGMNNIYSKYISDIENNNHDSDIYKDFIDNQDNSYIENTSKERMIIDYIAGMTDDYFKAKIKR